MSTSKTTTTTNGTSDEMVVSSVANTGTGLVVSKVADTMLSTVGFNPFEQFDGGFESQDVEFFDPKELLGVELHVYLKDVISLNIKGEDKVFVRGYVKTDTDAKMYHFGQHQILATFNRNDKGMGVNAKITFEGKQMIGVKSLNMFKIEAKSL